MLMIKCKMPETPAKLSSGGWEVGVGGNLDEARLAQWLMIVEAGRWWDMGFHYIIVDV